MTLPRTTSSSRSPSTLPRASSDVGMTGNTTGSSTLTPPPPLSSCMPATSLNAVSGNSPSTKNSRWLPHIMPIDGSNASYGDKSDPEQAVEVEEELALDDRKLPLAFNYPRHKDSICGVESESQGWRMRERMKTVSVALVICLNVGVDPPDVTKTQPCARVECWIDPAALNPARALEAIGNNLQKQYERWQPRARYRQSLDPTVDEVRRLATGLRRNARDERVLFHYNGHGVPKPTSNGEIWVFNRSYTQYIPLSLYDLQSWMGSPSIFVYDCSNAGIIVNSFEQFAEQHERDFQAQVSQNSGQGKSPNMSTNIQTASMKNCIQLAACSSTQLLPMNPELPADLFTACLTTPIKMALRWFVMQNQGKLAPRITVEMLDKIPGQFGDRRTMLGELNWIFTAITDTIAWNTLPRTLFQKLFRQDLLVASLFRNFLLAERVMRSYDCTPVSQPTLPSTHQHAMWQAWDFAVDISLSQLPNILEKNVQYNASSFFEEQLTAFEVWLKYGGEKRPPPEQLPIVLQVLLSQAHRLRALDLLGRFLDLGPWAVNLALSVGIFPYVLKLLQSSARELRPLLVSIWAKILAVDTSCQTDLIRDSSHKYFLSVLQDDCMMPNHRTWAAFILASIVHNYKQGQQEAEQGNLIATALEHLDDEEPVLRQWLAIALGRVWDAYEPARWRGARNNAHEKLFELLKDPVPEVRAAAVFALGTFINSCEERTEHANNLDHSIALNLINAVSEDGSQLVRQELVVALQYVVLAFESNFVNVKRQAVEDEERQRMQQLMQNYPQLANQLPSAGSQYHTITSTSTTPNFNQFQQHHHVQGHGSNLGHNLSQNLLQPSVSSSALDRLGNENRSTGNLGSVSSISSLSHGNIYSKLWNGLILLASDPHPEVASMSSVITNYIHLKARESHPVGGVTGSIGSSLTIAGRDATGRTSSLETCSVPSSPSKPSFMLQSPSNQQSGLKSLPPQPLQQSNISSVSPGQDTATLTSTARGRSFTVHPIKEEAMMSTHKKTENDQQQSSSPQQKLPPTVRAGSVGRHPSGGHHSATSVPTPNGSNTNISSVSNTPAMRSHNLTRAISQLEQPNLTTHFMPWSAKYFTKQLMSHECVECDCDHESGRHWKKEWLYNRNHAVRLEAERQHELIKKGLTKVDTSPRFTSLSASSTYVLKMLPTPGTPANVIAFHPYNPKIVVAGNNHIKMWDIKQGILLSSPELKQHRDQQRQQNLQQHSHNLNSNRVAQITSLDYINAHEDALLLVACDDGTLRLFKDYDEDGDEDIRNLDESMSTMSMNSSTSSLNSISGSRIGNKIRSLQSKAATTHRLVSAWNGLRELVGYSYRGSLNPVTSGLPVHTAWSQYDLTLAVGGDARYIRLWDARKELKRADLLTGSDSFVSSLTFSSYYAASSTSGIFTAGFGDGSVKLFDIRTPDTGVATFSDMNSPILDCRLQEETVGGQQIIIAGSANGEVRIYEPRKAYSTSRVSTSFGRLGSYNEGLGSATLGTVSLGHPVTGLSIHQRAQLFAAWTPHNQQVSVHMIKSGIKESTSSQSNTGGISSMLNVIKYHDEGMLGHKLGPEGCLMFHPNLVQLAIGSKEGAISIKKVKGP